MLNNFVSRWPVFVITYNLAAFEPRREFMAQQLGPRRITFIDASNVSNSKVRPKREAHVRIEKTYGSFLSHLEAYRVAIKSSPPGGGVLIFEDDALLAANWESALFQSARGFPPANGSTLVINDPRANQTAGTSVSAAKACNPKAGPERTCTWPAGPIALFFGTCLGLFPDTHDKCLAEGGACIRLPNYHQQPAARPLSRCTHAYAIQRECAALLLDKFATGGVVFQSIDRWLNMALRVCMVVWTTKSLASQASQGVGAPPSDGATPEMDARARALAKARTRLRSGFF